MHELLKDGIYEVDIDGIHCEVKVESGKIIDGYIEHYDSDIILAQEVINQIDLSKLLWRVEK